MFSRKMNDTHFKSVQNLFLKKDTLEKEEEQKKANEEEKNKVANVNTVLNVIIAAVVSDTLT